MTKRRVEARGQASSCHSSSMEEESSKPASSSAAPVPTPCDEASASTAAPKLDLDGFDLTDFARFLRETAPDWVAGSSKPSPVDRPLKR